jgi:tRNA-2-methylthio-N6-dimethylallyladenosine synthase
LREVANIEGLARLRYTTSHPRDMDDDLIAAHGEIPALMPFLHLPVQSGSDRVLKAMNRGHTADDFVRVVDRLRAARPDIALSSDFIAGHPGETEADHQATLALIGRVGFAQSFSFKYSPRPGTPAAGAPLQVEEAEKDRRLQEIQALLREQQAAFNRSRRRMRMDVLITGPGRHAGQIAGRSPWLQPVHADGPADLIGQVVACDIVAAHTNSLAAEIALSPAPKTLSPSYGGEEWVRGTCP